MASHFSAIGMPFTDKDTYLQGVQRIAEAAGEPEDLSEGRLLYSWRDDSGAAADVLVEVTDGQLGLRCATPRHDSESRSAGSMSMTSVPAAPSSAWNSRTTTARWRTPCSSHRRGYPPSPKNWPRAGDDRRVAT